MSHLNKYSETIKLAGKSIKNCYAYCMDGESPCPNDMRKDVGLGTCSCADYFSPQSNSILIIEEGQIAASVDSYKNDYEFCNSTDQTKYAEKQLLKEFQLKAYGSLIVLCRLSAICESVRDLLKNKKYEYWVIVSDKKYNVQFLEHLTSNLKSTLSKQIVKSVKVIFRDDFEEEFRKGESLKITDCNN